MSPVIKKKMFNSLLNLWFLCGVQVCTIYLFLSIYIYLFILLVIVYLYIFLCGSFEYRYIDRKNVKVN